MFPDAKALPGDADLQREFERISLSFRAMGGGLWDYDVDADALYCNARWYEILGLDPALDAITSIEGFKPHIHPDDVALATAINRRELLGLADRNECYRVEFRVVRPDGAPVWLRSVACVIRDGASGHLRAVGCVTDISEFRGAASPLPAARPAATERMARPPAPAPASAPAPRVPLTEKERSCLLWVSVGKTAWETAAILGLSRRTVEFHLAKATRKLNAGNKVHAAFIALRHDLLDDA